MDTNAPVTAYVHMHALDGASEALTRLRADALRALGNELASLRGVRVSALPQEADLDVEITNVMRVDEGLAPRAGGGGRPRILVVRLCRRGERLDIVCTDGRSAMPAERQAARRIQGWVAAARPPASARPERGLPGPVVF
jgi:hypothetical protein